MATPSPFVISPVLSTVAVGYRNEALIADKIFPKVMVGNKLFKYLVYPQIESFSVPNTAVGRRGRPQNVEFTATEITVSCIDHALQDTIPVEDYEIAAAQRALGLSAYDPEERAVLGLSDLIDLDREVRSAGIAFNAANFPASNVVTLSGNAQFSSYLTCDPIAVFAQAFRTTFRRPNTMVIGYNDMENLRQSVSLAQAVKGLPVQKAYLSDEEIMRVLKLKEIIIGEPYVNISNKGQNQNLTRVWDNKILLFYKDPLAFGSPTDGRMSFGFTGVWKPKQVGVIPDSDVSAYGGQRLRVMDSLIEVTAATQLGYLIQGVSH